MEPSFSGAAPWMVTAESFHAGPRLLDASAGALADHFAFEFGFTVTRPSLPFLTRSIQSAKKFDVNS